jgi:hypothetical protein
MEDIIFWKHWEMCKYIADGMQKALEKAKQNNPNNDYTEAENKIKIMSEIQTHLGKMQERVIIIKELNFELNESIFKTKAILNEYIKENKALKEENNNLKQNLSI